MSFDTFSSTLQNAEKRKGFYDKQIADGFITAKNVPFEKFEAKLVGDISAENTEQNNDINNTDTRVGSNDTVQISKNEKISEQGIRHSDVDNISTHLTGNSLVIPKIQETGLVMEFIYEHPNYYKEVQLDNDKSDYNYYKLRRTVEKRLVYKLNGKNDVVFPPTNSILNTVFRAYAKNPTYHKQSHSIIVQAYRHLLRYDINSKSWDDIGRCYSFKLFEQGKYQGEIYCPYDKIRVENGQSYGKQSYYKIIDVNGDESFGTFRKIEIDDFFDN